MNNIELEDTVHKTLKKNYIDSKNIYPSINNNVITLKGTVKSNFEVELTQNLISNIDGVKKVKNFLKTLE